VYSDFCEIPLPALCFEKKTEESISTIKIFKQRKGTTYGKSTLRKLLVSKKLPKTMLITTTLEKRRLKKKSSSQAKQDLKNHGSKNKRLKLST
jgi:hypothetical protein